jgi:cobalt/nickel transport system permease protein
MHDNLFDRYHARTSLIHRLDPRVKVVITLSFILSNVLLPDGAWLAFALAFAAVLVVSALADLGPGYALRRSFVALPFFLAAFSAIFALPGQPLITLALGSWRLTATDAGLLRFASIVIRSWLSVQLAILLAATTQFPDLLHALRHLRVPQVLVAVVAFMYRYLFVLTDETLRLLRARQARSARLAGPPAAGGTLAWRARVAGNLAGQLFLRSYERSDRVYSAMLARGYTGRWLTLNPHHMRRVDWLAGGVGALALVLLQALGWLG